MARSCVPVKKDHLSCRICHEGLQNPATIPCGHSFCMLCIKGVWDRSVGWFSCPECNHVFSLRPLIENITLTPMVGDIESSGNKTCTKQSHSTGPQTLPGRPTSIKRTRAARTRVDELCLKHKCPVVAHCCNDGQLLCAQCALLEHEGHKTELVSEAFKKKKEHLNDSNKKAKQTLQKQESEVKKLKDSIKQFEEMARGTEDKCEIIFVKLIDSLQRHYGTVRELIEAQERAAVAQAQSSLEKLELGIDMQRRRVEELDQLAQTTDDVLFLQRRPSLLLHCEEDDYSNLTVDPHLVFTPINEAVKEFGKRVENNIEMEINTISQTVNSDKTPSTLSSDHTVALQPNPDSSAQTEQNQTEPKTRSEFLHYAYELTLDSNTAHEDLVLSDRDREVRLCPNKQKARRHQDRFAHRRQVLCIEGLQADHCYYEVMVCGGKAEIALAYKSINRKSSTRNSAFGGNDKSWSLDRSKTYSVCHKDKGVLLTATPSQNRIGVYLKFKEGTISFYEVSETMTFLYRVEALFAEALFPGFWLDEKCHIKLCDLRQDTVS